jgi:hypothetical protein
VSVFFFGNETSLSLSIAINGPSQNGHVESSSNAGGSMSTFSALLETFFSFFFFLAIQPSLSLSLSIAINGQSLTLSLSIAINGPSLTLSLSIAIEMNQVLLFLFL